MLYMLTCVFEYFITGKSSLDVPQQNYGSQSVNNPVKSYLREMPVRENLFNGGIKRELDSDIPNKNVFVKRRKEIVEKEALLRMENKIFSSFPRNVIINGKGNLLFYAYEIETESM